MTNYHFTGIFMISIHALLAESDPGKVSSVLPGLAFLSTLSLRRATEKIQYACTGLNISIHALLAESDGFEVQA